jgi:lambda repressor-like predicted transcriptional regulator
VLAGASRERAGRHLSEIAADAARRHGYPDIRAHVLDRLAAGESLATMSRAAGLHKDWLSRHLGRLDAVTAEAARAARAGGRRGTGGPDAALLPALSALGFADVPEYLRDRHLGRHWTVNAIAAETGLSYHTVAAALTRHGVARLPHDAKRHAAAQREAEVAAELGYDGIALYVAQRRAAGWTWRAIAAESGQPPTWLRRHAAAAG